MKNKHIFLMSIAISSSNIFGMKLVKDFITKLDKIDTPKLCISAISACTYMGITFMWKLLRKNKIELFYQKNENTIIKQMKGGDCKMKTTMRNMEQYKKAYFQEVQGIYNNLLVNTSDFLQDLYIRITDRLGGDNRQELSPDFNDLIKNNELEKLNQAFNNEIEEIKKNINRELDKRNSDLNDYQHIGLLGSMITLRRIIYQLSLKILTLLNTSNQEPLNDKEKEEIVKKIESECPMSKWCNTVASIKESDNFNNFFFSLKCKKYYIAWSTAPSLSLEEYLGGVINYGLKKEKKNIYDRDKFYLDCIFEYAALLIIWHFVIHSLWVCFFNNYSFVASLDTADTALMILNLLVPGCFLILHILQPRQNLKNIDSVEALLIGN